MGTRRSITATIAIVSGIAIAVGLPVTVMAKLGPNSDEQQGRLDRESETSPGSAQTEHAPDIELASLESPLLVLPQLKAAAVPDTSASEAAQTLADADALLESNDIRGAARAYVRLMESHPDTPHAEAAGFRLDHMLARLSEADLDEMEYALLPPESLLSNPAQKFAAGFCAERAARQMETDPQRAAAYLDRVMELSWTNLQGALDDPEKSELLEQYLAAADHLGVSDSVRDRLSAYAGGLAPCFTSWLIKTVVDGDEPPMDDVPGFDGKVAIRKHFMRTGKRAADSAEATECFEKARDVSLRLLLDQPRNKPALYLAAMYLQAATLLGDRESAVAELEAHLETEPLSIMRWIVRGELAMDLVQPGRSEAETRAGFAHFDAVAEEAGSKTITTALNDPLVEDEVRGIMVCMLGHAYLGTNQVEEARRYYEWVVENYPREVHAGDSASYSLVELGAREENRDPGEIAADFEAFASENPSGPYSPAAFNRAAEIYEMAMDLDSARLVYERLTREYPASPIARGAAESLRRIQVE